jgi:hypothetical protein
MDIDNFEKANSYANICFLGISLALTLAFLIRFRFKAEKSAYIIILSYIFTIGPRVFLTT